MSFRSTISSHKKTVSAALAALILLAVCLAYILTRPPVVSPDITTPALAVAALAWGGVLLVAMPLGLGHLVLGSIAGPAYPLVLPTVLAIAGNCAGMGPGVGMHAMSAARRSLRASLWNSALVIPAGISGALVGGVLGSLYFTAAAAWITTVMSWWYFRKAIRESSNVPVPGWMWPGSGRRPAAADAREDRVQAEVGAGR